jgi:acetoacetate decarboxylase
MVLRNAPQEIIVKDEFFQMDGFTDYRSYLESDYVEVLTFYGDMFDWNKKELLENHVIMVVDRHKSYW